MSFPASPTNGQQILLGNVTYQFNSSKTAWIRVPGLVGANLNVISVTASSYYWANGMPFASSTYANSNVASYLPTDSTILGISSNVSTLQSNVTTLQSNAATQGSEISGLRANITAANAAILSANSYSITLNTSMAANITAANAAIITANSSMKTYVDSQVISSGGYSNVAMTAYLAQNNITVANITGGGVRTTSTATPPANPSVGDVWYSTGEDRIYRYTSDGTTKAWLDITGAEYTFDMSGEMSITGNIIPSANAVYSIGSSAYRFSNVYTTGNVTTGNVLATGYYFANGTPFVSSNYGNTEVSAYLASYYTYANANAATQATAISTIQTQVYSNVNTAAYLAGNVTTGNVFTNGLYYANGTPFSTGGTSTSAYMLSYIFGA